ncbi:hypothetical protein V1L54_09950 [Streptomyces sp. TRM 70361]|uniref:hypothetical protein n=1 Tax=Streptomyces sp. TRM 70361 TaxID=3116553 RepID=UPI002E7BCD20|nr:hypothetical protein [Streptomyces sp. TRM 70361]MEE1939725.1 hypothetical protein [Streptomyces sp. TRM 70361]
MTARKIGPGAWRDYEPSEFGTDAHRTQETYRPVSGETPEERPPARLRDALSGRNGQRLS